MPRPVKERLVAEPPLFSDFKPSGVQGRSLKKLDLGLDEFEALRLADYLNMEHAEAAAEMNISRSTFTRLVEKARHKIALFLVEGRRLTIAGGTVHFGSNLLRCLDCGSVFTSEFDSSGSSDSECPDCGSGSLEDLAQGYGHGECCRGKKHNTGR
jgi:predicted DNA-binding protein (UPF0251 family)